MDGNWWGLYSEVDSAHDSAVSSGWVGAFSEKPFLDTSTSPLLRSAVVFDNPFPISYGIFRRVAQG